MSVRYTAVASMGEPSRDIEPAALGADRWRDKIELRLDNRQVFFLFFGSAVVACMLFVLGVMVGKRIESRGQAEAPELQDPLAALDRARQPPPGVAAPDPQLTFPNTLIGGGTRAKAVGARPAPVPKPAPLAVPPKPIAAVAPAAPPKPIAAVAPAAPPKPIAAVAPAAPPKPIAAVAPAAPPKPIAAVAPAAAPKPILVAAAPRTIALVAAPKLAQPATPPRPLAAAPKPLVPLASKGADTLAVKAPPARAETAPAATKGKFTLHLSTFGTAESASAFADKYPGAFVVAGEVPGKGLAYRVRYGNFASFKDAAAAKDNFEKQHNVIALVAAR